MVASVLITSLQNPLVKQLRKLHQAKERHRQGQFLLEGTHLIEAACATGYRLDLLCYTPSWQQQYPELALRAEQQATQTRVVSAEVLRSVATTVSPDGAVAAARRRLTQPTDALPLPSLGVAIERLQDPGNLGTIIRTAAAAAADQLWVSADCVDVDHPKVLRASAGQWFRSPLQVLPSLPAAIAQLRASSTLQVIATVPTADLSYWAVNFCQPTLLLLGNEGQGLSAELMASATHQVSIPLAAEVESLNVGIAAALLLYEARRQRSVQPGERLKS